MNTVLIENKAGRKKEFRLLFELMCERGRKYVVFTDDRYLNDGSLHTIVVTLSNKNKVLKKRPTIEEMKYIERLMLSLSGE